MKWFSPKRLEIAEIDENVERNELNALERAEHFARRKVLYEAAHPETKKGGDRGNQHTGGKGRLTETVSFSQTAAVIAGLSDRTIRHDIQIATGIPEDIRDAIRDTPLADEKRQLLDLARLPEPEQRAVVEKIPAGDAITVKAAAHNHRAQGTGENEWYTPSLYIDAARSVMGEIDLDPTSSDIANATVCAAKFFSDVGYLAHSVSFA